MAGYALVAVEDVVTTGESVLRAVSATRDAGLEVAVIVALGPPLVAQGLRELIAGQRTDFAIEYPCHSPGDQRWFSLRATCFLDTGHISIVAAHHDISEHKRAQEALRRSEAQKAAVLDTALDAIVSIDQDGKVLEWNPAAARIFGYSRELALGREMAELIVPRSNEELHRKGLARFLQTRQFCQGQECNDICIEQADHTDQERQQAEKSRPACLGEMARVAPTVVVNDLLRTPVSLALVWLVTRLLRLHPVSRHDGPVSVRRAYSAAEVASLAGRVGLRLHITRYPVLGRLVAERLAP